MDTNSTDKDPKGLPFLMPAYFFIMTKTTPSKQVLQGISRIEM